MLGYMLDARFKTLEEVVEHYNKGSFMSEHIDPLMKTSGRGGLNLNENKKQDLIAFLNTLSDISFIKILN